jgi:hypothetical protein
MKRLTSGYRALTLQAAVLAGHTVRIAHSLIGLAGAALVSWGAAMIYVPAGWIAGGAFLLWLATELAGAAGARAARRER